MALKRIRTLAAERGYDLNGYSSDLLRILDQEVSSASARELLHDPLSRVDREGLFRMAMSDIMEELERPGDVHGTKGRAFPVLSVAAADVLRDAAEAVAEALDPRTVESESTYMIAAMPQATPTDVADHVIEKVKGEIETSDEAEVYPGEPVQGGLGFIKGVGTFFSKLGSGIADAAPYVGKYALLGPLGLAMPTKAIKEIGTGAVGRFISDFAGQAAPEVRGMVERSARNVEAARPEISRRISRPMTDALRSIFLPPPRQPRPPEAEFPVGAAVAVGGGLLLVLAFLGRR